MHKSNLEVFLLFSWYSFSPFYTVKLVRPKDNGINNIELENKSTAHAYPTPPQEDQDIPTEDILSSVKLPVHVKVFNWVCGFHDVEEYDPAPLVNSLKQVDINLQGANAYQSSFREFFAFWRIFSHFCPFYIRAFFWSEYEKIDPFFPLERT